MNFNYHINISTEGKTYEFDLIAQNRNLSSGYKVNPNNKEDYHAIQAILESVNRDGSLTIDTLASRLKHLSPILHVKITNLFTNHFPLDPSKNTEIESAHTRIDESEIIQRSLKHLKSLLHPDKLPANSEKLLCSKEGHLKIKAALNQPLPGFFPEEKPSDEKKLEFPPLLAKLDITMREAMVVGAMAVITGKSDELVSKLDISKKGKKLGDLIEIEPGRSVHYQLIGKQEKGDPCIIMQSGLGNDGGHWKKVQNNLLTNSKYASLSYDRSGIAISDPNFKSDPSNINEIVSDLDKLLTKLEEKGEIRQPYLLVGHSFGGACMQAYALAYPDKVSGLVLVDSSSDTQRTELGKLADPKESPHVDFPDHLMPPKLASLLFDDALNELSAYKEDKSFMDNLEILAKMKGVATHPFGNLPLHVISREIKPDEIEEKDRDRILKAAEYNDRHLRNGSTHCKNTKLSGVSHFIHREAPDKVAEIILEMV